jgi:O-acetyl-ADP-ribose deacetylase (regulator of RNase III)
MERSLVTRPAVFIGSSSEGKRMASAVQAALRSDAEVTIWDQGIFGLGQVPIESLTDAMTQFDFAVLVLTPDDVVRSRSKQRPSARDNVLFELGLFMGALGRDRTFIMQQLGSGLKIPSDLVGVKTADYDWPREDMNYRAAVSTATEEIRERMRALGKRKHANDSVFAGLDPTLVTENDGVVSATISGWNVNPVTGRIEDFSATEQTVIVLPCNEYFDDECAFDKRSALGAYVNRTFPGRTQEFMSKVKAECQVRLGPGTQREKVNGEKACSFGPGRALLMRNVLDSLVPLGLVSTTTQRAGQGLTAKASFVFEGLCELITRMVDARLNEVVIPLLGAGHGGMDPATAFVTLVLALAEAIRYVPGRPLRTATTVIFRKDEKSPPEVAPVVVRRALALAAAPRHVPGSK